MTRPTADKTCYDSMNGNPHGHERSKKIKACKQVSILFSVPPSPELVERVRDLYHKRVPDVRFLIPVINGLEKVKTPSDLSP